MKADIYIKKVTGSQDFKQFMKEDPKAYLCSLFFTKDFNEKHTDVQVDFYSPKRDSIISFKANKGVERVPELKKAETMTHKKFIPKPLTDKIMVDLDEIEPSLVDEMHNRGMTYQIDKILAFVNITEGEVIWNCTAFLRGLGLLIARLEDKTNTVLFMEKKSFFDLISFTKGTGQKTEQIPIGKATEKAVGKTENSVKKDVKKK